MFVYYFNFKIGKKIIYKYNVLKINFYVGLCVLGLVVLIDVEIDYR